MRNLGRLFLHPLLRSQTILIVIATAGALVCQLGPLSNFDRVPLPPCPPAQALGTLLMGVAVIGIMAIGMMINHHEIMETTSRRILVASTVSGVYLVFAWCTSARILSWQYLWLAPLAILLVGIITHAKFTQRPPHVGLRALLA